MALDLLALLSLPAIIALGFITTRSDLRHGTIRNAWIAYALVYSLVLVVATSIVLTVRGDPVNVEYLIRYPINIMFAALAAMAIWMAGLWSAGDGKLFIAYAALLPLSVYSSSAATYFPAFLILVYTFVPLLLFWLVRILVKSKGSTKLALLWRMLSPRFLSDTVLFVFAFSWLGSALFSYLGTALPVTSNPFMLLLFIFLVMALFRRVLKIPYRNACIVIAVIGLVFDPGRIFTAQFLQHFLIVLLLFLLLRHFLLNLAFEVFTTPVDVENLQEGMVAAENYTKEKRRWHYQKIRMPSLALLSAFLDPPKTTLLLPRAPAGLSEEDVEKVKRYHSKGRIREHTLRIFQTVPFAPFMFLGVLLTILLESGIVPF